MAADSKWDARLYDTKHSFVWEKAKGVVELLGPQPGEKILDLGCGTGALTAEIAAKGATVIGVDQSADMISQAKKKFPAIRFEICDARELQFSEEFDAVFSNAALHWIPEADKVVRGVSWALRTGGRFVAEFGGKGNVAHVVSALEESLQRLGISPIGVNPWYYPSIAEYGMLLESHRIEVVEAALFERPTPLEDGENGLRNWVAMFCGAFLNRLPSPRHDEFFSNVEELAKPGLWKADHWELDYRRLRILAVKLAA